jgi:hypothetical protein
VLCDFGVCFEESRGPKHNQQVLSKALHPSSFHCCQPQDPSHVFVLLSLLALCVRLCALPLVIVCPRKLLKERATNQGVTRPACQLSLSLTRPACQGSEIARRFDSPMLSRIATQIAAEHASQAALASVARYKASQAAGQAMA